MELAGSESASPDHGSHLLIAEGCRGSQVIAVARNCGVAVNEIHPLRSGVGIEQWAVAAMLQWGPTHVRDAFAAAFREAFHASTEQSETRITSFITVFEQQLKAETDAEQRSIVIAPALQMRHQPCGPEVGHGGVKSSDPRKDQSVDAIELISAFDQPAAFT
jgi:hypothetical protein